MNQITRDKLTFLKGEYTGNPFDKDNNVQIEFLYFVVERYEGMIEKVIKIAEKKKENNSENYTV